MEENKYNDPSIKELLEIGIKAEIEAKKYYNKLLETDISSELKGTIEDVLEEEKGHEKKLREIFNDFYPDKEPELPDEKFDHDIIKMNLNDTEEIIEELMESEKESQKFYEIMAERFSDTSPYRTAKYLAYIERTHYQLLKDNFKN